MLKLGTNNNVIKLNKLNTIKSNKSNTIKKVQ